VFFVLPVLNSINTPVREVALDSSGAIIRNDPTRQIRSYVASSTMVEPDEQQKSSQSREVPASIAIDYLQLPQLNPRIPQLARDVTKDAKSIYDKAAAMNDICKTNTAIAGDGSHSGRNRSAVVFPFHAKKGHCEYSLPPWQSCCGRKGFPQGL